MRAETSGLTSPPAGALETLAARAGRVLAGEAEGRGLRIGVACSRSDGGITWRLLDGALGRLAELGVDRSDITVAWVPGAFELPLLVRALSRAGVDAVVCLGAVVRGETAGFEHVAGQTAAGVQRVQLVEGVPVAWGVLTTETADQALARSRPDGTNRGRDAAAAAVETARLLRAL